MGRSYYVYIMSNKSGTLYTGVTGDLERRVAEHKMHLVEGFTSRYRITSLVYYEETTNVDVALQREKQIMGWVRRRKVEPIESTNPQWRDLSED